MKVKDVMPEQWAPPCNSQCTHKYAALMQIPWRVFCKKGCDADGDTWEDCSEECEEICYKNPVLKDQQWSAYIDRSPGAASCSEECFHACVAGCGYKFDIPSQKVDQTHPSKPHTPLGKEKLAMPAVKRTAPPIDSNQAIDDVPGTSA